MLLLAIILSFGPAFFYAWITYSMDRFEKEPRLMLGGVFLWGAVVAVIGAIIASLVLEAGVSLATDSAELTELIGGSVIAPVVEEFYKGLAVLLVYIVFRNEFDSVLDGIIYAGIAALGFAASENVLYLYSAGAEEGLGGLLVLFVLRVILGGWNHAVYTAFTGIGLAISRLSTNRSVRILAPLVGLLTAMLMHSLHNTMVALLARYEGLGLLATLLTDWISWLLIFSVILWAIRREQGWINTYLREEVEQGLITVAQQRTAASWWGRFGARLRGLSHGRYRVTQRFYQLCSELAQKKHQLATLGEEVENSATIERLRNEIAQTAPQANA